MKKSLLETFIKKYSLNGTVESVKWNVTPTTKTLSTNAITEERNVLIDVKYSNFDAITESAEIGIYETSKLSRMMSVLSDEINIVPNKKDEKITSLSFSDSNTDVQFITADLTVIPASPNLKSSPTINAEIVLNDVFISKFIKAKNALQEVDTFTLLMNKGKKLELVLGYSKLNSNRITIAVETVGEKKEVSKNISFNAKYFKEILTANSDADQSILQVSNAGLSTIHFKNDATGFSSSYYMVEVRSVD